MMTQPGKIEQAGYAAHDLFSDPGMALILSTT
jgi:hypothetical protein